METTFAKLASEVRTLSFEELEMLAEQIDDALWDFKLKGDEKEWAKISKEVSEAHERGETEEIVCK